MKKFLVTLFLVALVLVLQKNTFAATGNAANDNVSAYFTNPKKTQAIAEAGIQTGLNKYSSNGFKINFSGEYFVNPRFSMGAGAGFRHYFEKDGGLIPLFVVLRGTLKEKGTTPFVSMAAGYAFSTKNQFKAQGPHANGVIGYVFSATDGLRMSLGVNFEVQQMVFYRFDGQPIPAEFKETTNNLGITLGFYF